MWKMIGIASILGWFMPILALAAPYYEFNPDYSQSILVASSETTSEIFLPLNEFLSGFDFWLSNNNQSGEASFTLYNDQSGAQLAQKTVTVPAIADANGGTRFHVDLSSQLSVSGGLPYRITISTALPSLRLYYADQNELLAHNGSPVQQYSGGLARIGNEDKGFSFKFALYETNETVAPVLSSVGTTQTTIDEVVLSFNANEPVDSRVLYNTNLINWTGSYTSCVPGIQTCTVHLPVTPATTYSYTLTARDVWGNSSTFSGNFTSMNYGETPTPTPSGTVTPTPTPSTTQTPTPTPDTTAPIITNARTVSLLPNSSGFAWTTNKAANSTVVVQLVPDLITVNGNSDATLELEHYVNINQLTPDTYYQATITSADASNNTSTAIITFLTPKTIPPPTPTPSTTPSSSPSASSTPAPSGNPAPSPTPNPNDPTLHWPAPSSGEPSGGYRIDIFDANNNLVKSITVPKGTHQASVPGLKDGTHRAVVYSNDNGVYQKVAAPTTIEKRKKPFLERLLSSLPYILGGLVAAIGITIATLHWRKPKPLAAPLTPPTPPISPNP